MPNSRVNLKGHSESLRAIATPLGFYALALLIVESTLTVVLIFSKLSEAHIWAGFLGMLSIFACTIIIVTLLAVFAPDNLLYGKEEHRKSATESLTAKLRLETVFATSVDTHGSN